MISPVRQKVLGDVMRQKGPRTELLVFDHVGMPEAGTQVPAGTVEPGETPAQAVVREILEETGLAQVQVARFIGRFRWFCALRREVHDRHVFVLTPNQPLPDQWLHTVSAGVEDAGLVFSCYWLDADAAESALTGDQGIYLGHVG